MSDDFFNDPVPSASFRGEPPVVWEGEILDLTKKQATTYDPDNPGGGEPRFWGDGNPMMQGWITLQTKVREDDEDDGRRVLVLDSKNKRTAVQNAVRETGHKIAVGGTLRVEYYGRDPQGKNPDNLPKLYRAWYTPPAETPTVPPQAGAPASTPTATVIPTPAPATASGGDGGDAEALVKVAKAGLDVSKLSSEQIKLLAATL